MSYLKAKRKKRISKFFWYGRDFVDYYDNLHQYSKNKIHCSCPLCQVKTKNKGHRRYKKGNYNPSLNYKYSELKRQISMDDELREFLL